MRKNVRGIFKVRKYIIRVGYNKWKSWEEKENNLVKRISNIRRFRIYRIILV